MSWRLAETKGRISQTKREARQLMFGGCGAITSRWRMDAATKERRGRWG